MLEAVSPLKVIAKGYAAVTNAEGNLVRRVSDTAVGQTLTFRVSDGAVDAAVTAIRNEDVIGEYRDEE